MGVWGIEDCPYSTSAPVFALPNIKGAADGSAPFVVQTDASGIALGGVLMQDNGDGNGLRVIAYESRQFSAAEQNYHTGERELGALHHCTTVTWRHYLILTNFRIQGDHRPLEWLMEPGRELSRRQARWCMDLVEVGVPRTEYIKGALLLVPDALSRRPDFKDKDARDGLKEAGVIDPVSDKPTNPLASLVADYISPSPPSTRPHWAQRMDSWLAAVETISAAEDAIDMVETIALMNPKTYKGKMGPGLDLDMTSPSAPAAVKTPTPSERVTRSKSKRESVPPDSAPQEVVSSKKAPALAQREAPVRTSKKTVATPQPQQSAPPLSPHAARRRWTRMPEDTQNWRVRKEYFDKYTNKFGKFDVDACCDLGGHNRQVDRFWSNCLDEKWRGLQVWCNPPYNSNHIIAEAILYKYIQEWRADPEHTSAVFILPDLQSKLPAWRRLFRLAGMQIVEVIPTHDDKGEPNQVFETPNGKAHDLLWPVLVVHAPPAKPQADTKPWKEFSGGFGGEELRMMLALGSPPAQSAKQSNLE
ncbi:hypothetical protein CYMTET_10656 [Cymbomonas tetramitiformis]|uniref:Reverse transcriptase RNase H-like domain-containing protein n=1 Tax=Cymbomonas tetramitiformis TaxID=36881 RepID=A0AAE0LDY5_9CHLO|nr:hypothetical protein CYMTET_10656 [Cymbomonas tetramitiformis]